MKRHKLLTLSDDRLTELLRDAIGLPADARIEDVHWFGESRTLKIVVSSGQFPSPQMADLWGDFPS